MAITGSYLGGYFIGWVERRAIKITSIVAGILLAAIALFVSWGWKVSTAQSWVNSASAWIGESIEGAGRYLISLLPYASAAGVVGHLDLGKNSQSPSKRTHNFLSV